MIATLAALQLLLAQPAPPPKEATPAETAPAEARPEQQPPPGGDSGAAPANAPLPERRTRSAAAPPRAPSQRSLLSGESLGGGTASLVWAGWSSIGILYGQGITPDDDLAALGSFDWADTELRLGGLYRRPLGRA